MISKADAPWQTDAGTSVANENEKSESKRKRKKTKKTKKKRAELRPKEGP